MTKRFSIGIVLVFSSYSLVVTQSVPFLTDMGYSPFERGLVLSFVGLVSIFGQIYMGFMSDRYATIKKFFLYLTFMLVLLVGLSFIVRVDHFPYYFLVLGFASGLTRILVNMYETWVMEIDELRPDFGRIRAFGSMGWAFASLFSGYLIAAFSYSALAYVCALLSLIFAFLSLKMRDAEKTAGLDIKVSDIKVLFHNKNYVLFLIVYFVTYFVYNADAVTVTDLIINLGGTSKTVGIKWFVQAMSELPMLMFGAHFLLRYKGCKLMVFASIMMAIRMFLLALTRNTTSIILLSTLQAITYPLILLSQKHLVYNELPPHLRSTGQMVAVSLTAGLAAVLMPVTSGLLTPLIGIRAFLTLVSFLMLIPIVLMQRSLT